MTDPTASTAAALAAGATSAAMVPGVDGNALVGAIAGGALFVVQSKDPGLLRRGVYLLVSIAVGYLAAPDLLHMLPIDSTGVAAFLAGSCAVTVATQLLDRLRHTDLLAMFRRSR